MDFVTFIKQNKQIAALIVVAILLIPFAYRTLHSTEPAAQVERTAEKDNIPTVTVIPTVFTAATITVTPTSIDPQKKLMDMVQNRRPLSSTDQTAKQTILAKLPSGQDSGELYRTDAISIEYVHSPDLFQVDILTNDISNDKALAVAWFKQNGMSEHGICSLPLTFYLDYQIKNQQTSQFNPLPESC